MVASNGVNDKIYYDFTAEIKHLRYKEVNYVISLWLYSDFMFFETELGHADVILIPGASQPQLMEKAAMLHHQGIAPFILPSGGTTPYVETTEWEFLRNIGVSLGGSDRSNT